MARKSYYEILKDLAPKSTGNHPIVVSMPFLFYHLGKYHVVSLVTGGQSEGGFVKKNHDAGRLLGVAFYHPDEGTGEYLSPARAKEKYGLNLTNLIDPKKVKISLKQFDPEVKLPRILNENIAERFIKSRATLEMYNSHITLAAAKNLDEGARYMKFILDPEECPRYPNIQRRKIFWLRFAILALLFGVIILLRTVSADYEKITQLTKDKQTLIMGQTELRSKLADTSINAVVLNGDYDADHIIPADDNNGQISDHVRGKADSKVVVIAYIDYQCPGCESAWPILRQLYNEFGDRVAFVHRNFPLSIHENANAAARAAEAAGRQGLYWEMSDALFNNSDAWSGKSGNDLVVSFRNLFSKLSDKVNITTFVNDMSADNVVAKVGFDRALGTVKHSVTYTPTIYVNGEKVDISSDGSLYSLVRDAIKKAL